MSDLLRLSARNVVGGDAALKSDGSAGAQSDTLDLKAPALGFHVNVAGTIKIRTPKDTDVTLTVLAGVYYAYGVKRVFDTGTSLADTEFALVYGY